VEPTPDLALNDYKITVLRPGDRPKALATISKCLKPAWTQRTISSATLSTTSWIVRTRRSKVLLFLSFQKSQQTRTTIESKPLRPIFGTSFLAASHQSDRLVVWVVCSCRICSLHWKDYTIDNQNGTPFVGTNSFLFCSADIMKLLWKKWACMFISFCGNLMPIVFRKRFCHVKYTYCLRFPKWSFILFSPS